MTCRQAPGHKQNELTAVKPALFREPSPRPGARTRRAFRRDRQVSRAGLGALSVAGDIRTGRPEQGKFSPCPGGRRCDLSLSASETHHPSPGRRALCFFGSPPTGRAQQSASRKALNLGPLHASALSPRAPSSSRSLSPLPSTQTTPARKRKTTPSQPQQARPSVAARASSPRVPCRPRLPAPARCVSAAAAFSCLAGRALPALRCGGDARSRPAAEAAWRRPPTPTEFKGAPPEQPALPNARALGSGVALTHLLDDSLSRGSEKDPSALLALPGLGSAPPWPTLGNRSPRAERGVRRSRRGLGKVLSTGFRFSYAGTGHRELL
ncbi:unnamed protein product [Rangifer tarandus platyrhynchus]|uniref:Uncharacterized protein n=2 Tax=Rangifer tarandus platyrhynchus TaxID=3082113 RepID=A0ABN8ZHV2_RANTA|nr:unnamed protein product [Rangifer tarandus platyrhynchus]CAI9708034.1 unnamed protein product [Rangifer tarandus platyrhynchus]